MTKLPHLIALCGNPKSGKSEVQKILQEQYGVLPVDDGGPLRDFAMRYLGLSRDDVYTQEGKARTTEILGTNWINRKILGDLGKQLEDMFGECIMPYMCARNLPTGTSYSFGSVRKRQGVFYKQHGGIVIGIRNPLAGPSPFEFDKFDETLVDYWIDNDALANGLDTEAGLADLRRKVDQFVADQSWARAA